MMTNEQYEESQRTRQKALSYPLPWRIWTYGAWLSNQLPEPQGLILSMIIIFGTMALIAGIILIAPWLLGGGLSWLFWLLLGMVLPLLLRPLGHSLRSVAQEILAIERHYKDHDERL